MMIEQGMAEADVMEAIRAATGYWLGNEDWQGWDGETDRLNQIAQDLNLFNAPLSHGDDGDIARSKINAIISAYDFPEGAAFYADFLNQRYYRTAQPSCVSASTRYSRNLAGVYQAFAPNELRLTDAGLYVPEGARTNKCTNFNANPTDLTNLTKFGDASSVLSVVDDTAMIEDAGLGEICTSGLVVQLDNTAGSTEAGCTFSGVVGNTNTHSFSVWARSILGANGRIGVAGFLGGIGSISFATSYRRESISGTPVNGSQASSIRVNGGGTVYFILNQLEEASTASTPIVTAGSAATRAADTVTIPAASGTYDLHLLLDDATEEVIEGFQNGDALPLTLPQGKFIEKAWGIAA